jgi:NADH-quinone oxidoreductase subunit J
MNSQWPWALLVSALTFALLVYIINIVWPLGIRAENLPVLAADPTKGLGMALVDWNQYVLPFEVASMLLLGAMVGSIFVAREPHDD